MTIAGDPGPIRAVVFDLDGTLVDTMHIMPRVYVDTIRLLGGPAIGAAEVVASWNIGPTATVLAHFLQRPIAADDVACFFDRFEQVAPQIRIFDGVDEMLRRLRSDGYLMGICTTATAHATAVMLAATGLAAPFREIVAGDHVTRAKPDPEGIRILCRRLGLRPSSVLFVGDADADMGCARAAGCVPVRAAWGVVDPGVVGDELVAHHPTDVPLLLQDLDSAPR